MKNTKLKNNLIICGVIAAAFIVAVVIYFVFDDKDVSLNNNEYSESLSLRGDLTASLIWNTKGIYSKYSEEYDYYYNKDKILVSEMDEDILLNLVLHRLDRLGELNDGIVEESLVKEEYKNIFGENTSYTMINSITYKCGKYVYAKKYNDYKEPVYYFINKTSSCDFGNNIVSASIASYKYDDRIEIIQAIGYISEDGTYYDAGLTNKVLDEVLDEYTMLGNDHLFKRYKYVFNYDEKEDSYYFYSVERHDGNV